jgi:RNA polymerase sigma-70 factor (ECF subfamily)
MAERETDRWPNADSESIIGSGGSQQAGPRAGVGGRRPAGAGGGVPRDQVDFDSFFAVEFPRVARTVYLIGHDYQRAQDVTQDAFVELLKRWEKVSRLERPGAWVRRVAIRKMMRSLRREAAQWEVLRREAEWNLRLAPREEGRDIDHVLAAIRSLSLRQRTAIVLFYYESATLVEIAEALGCSVSTAGVHLHRARGRLEALLGEVQRDDV